VGGSFARGARHYDDPVNPDIARRMWQLLEPWSFSTPALVLEARHSAIDAALRRIFGSEVDGDEVVEAARLARHAAEACDPAGRPLHAAHASLPWPDSAHMQLWHAATLLREHRGDGHVAVLVAEGIGGCEAHVTLVASGRSTAEMQREFRWWSEEDWAAATARLRARGLIDDAGRFTDDGRRLRDAIERKTDELAAPAYEELGAEGCDRLERALRVVIRSLADGDSIPYPNPMGLPDVRASGPG
jgi:hypothetical protein